MNKWKSISLSALLAAALFGGTLSTNAYANDEELQISGNWVTPFATAVDFKNNIQTRATIDNNESAATLAELLPLLRAHMLNRDTSFVITYTGSDLSSSNIMGAVQQVMNADDYLANNMKQYGFSSSGTRITFTMQYWTTKQQEDFVNSEVTRILDQIISPDMNDHEKVKAIHDYIVLNVHYDQTLVEHSAYAALAKSTTVCQGYSLLAYKMLKQAGLDARIQVGYAHSGGLVSSPTGAASEAHAWNLVNVDGAWYQLDPTWDDPTPDKPGEVSYTYYNITDAQMGKVHTWKEASPQYPKATASYGAVLDSQITNDASKADVYRGIEKDTGYLYIDPAYTASTQADLEQKIRTQLQNRALAFTIRYYNNGQSIPTIMNSVINKMTGLQLASWSYTYRDYSQTNETTDTLLTIYPKYTASLTSIAFTQNSYSVSAGTSAPTTLEATFSDNVTKAVSDGVSYQVADKTLASVNSLGTITAMGKSGNTTLSATYGGQTVSVPLTITGGVYNPVTDIALNQSTLSLTADSISVALIPTITPSNATNKKITWSSSNPAVASVSSFGVVTPRSAGTATITATTVDGNKSASCTVTVAAAVGDTSSGLKVAVSAYDKKQVPSNITVELYDAVTNKRIGDPVPTTASGTALFSNLPPAEYYIVITDGKLRMTPTKTFKTKKSATLDAGVFPFITSNDSAIDAKKVGAISGSVNGTPNSQVKIVSSTATWSTVTDEQQRFKVYLPTGTYNVIVVGNEPAANSNDKQNILYPNVRVQAGITSLPLADMDATVPWASEADKTLGLSDTTDTLKTSAYKNLVEGTLNPVSANSTVNVYELLANVDTNVRKKLGAIKANPKTGAFKIALPTVPAGKQLYIEVQDQAYNEYGITKDIPNLSSTDMKLKADSTDNKTSKPIDITFTDTYKILAQNITNIAVKKTGTSTFVNLEKMSADGSTGDYKISGTKITFKAGKLGVIPGTAEIKISATGYDDNTVQQTLQ